MKSILMNIDSPEQSLAMIGVVISYGLWNFFFSSFIEKRKKREHENREIIRIILRNKEYANIRNYSKKESHILRNYSLNQILEDRDKRKRLRKRFRDRHLCV